ncbi:hypothetical protein [Deinococcus multiflagellatus]|uniref:Alginate lyase domain-containing protein n=2 Tax=Deinococcus multiflagellatus TaxID=1656887 RepID=A0ABW1ZNF1_9DEIO
MRAFKGNKLSPALQVLLFFPFNLFYTPGRPDQEPTLPKPVGHEHFQYARYPRDRQGSTPLLTRRVWIRLGKSAANWPAARRRNERFMLPDYLYHFRTWANYVNIDNLVDLKGGGFKAYMDLDLMTLTFFYAGFAELLFIARFGEAAYLALAQDFHDRFVATQPGLNQRTAPWPLAVRLQIYKHLKLLDAQAWEPKRPTDPNTVAFCLED